MHELLPEGEDVRRAVRWVSDCRTEKSDKPLPELVQEAIFKFDISPKDAEFLIGFFDKVKEQDL